MSHTVRHAASCVGCPQQRASWFS